MKPSAYYERIVDVMEALMRFTVFTREHSAQLVDRYSGRKEAGLRPEIIGDLSSIAKTMG